jgi:7-cyano-7-deazaguanine synthase
VVARLTARAARSFRRSTASRSGHCPEWVLADRLTVRVQLQIHKIIWTPQTCELGMGAVVLLSGGSTLTPLPHRQADGFVLNALTIHYGQRHAREVQSARQVARALGVEQHKELTVDLRPIGGSSLTSEIDVPHDRDLDATDIPSTYVPARNTIFLSLALGWAEVIGARDLVVGVNALDYSGYPDCRPEFVRRSRRWPTLPCAASKARFRIHTPLIQLSKADITVAA